MNEQKEHRVTACEDLIRLCQTIQHVTIDEYWVQCDPVTECQSMDWQTESSLRPRNFQLRKSRMKMILARFIFLIPTKTEEQNSEFYIHVLETLLKQILRERQLVSFEQRHPLSFCLDYGVLPGELQHDGGLVSPC